MVNFKPCLGQFYQIFCSLLFILIFLFCLCTAEVISSLEMVKDVALHQGYRIKYAFKDRRYLDLEIIPSPDLLDWLVVTLEKSIPGSSRMTLQTYNGKELEEVGTPNSHMDVGNCKQIKSTVLNDTIFLLASKCDKNTQSLDVVVVDPLTLSLTKIQTLSHPFVEDVLFWTHIYTDELNLILLSRAKKHSNSPSTIFHYVFNVDNIKFTKLDKIKTSDGRAATVFHIEDRTYVAVSNYQDVSGKFADSTVYVQDINGSKLTRHQEIKSKGTIGLTYFCYIGDTKTEHFLLAANNRILKGISEANRTLNRHFIEESILFKWEDGYFIPFQTLLVRLPSPWIMVGSHESLVLLTWSFRDGIISYQYDGWRFRRTAKHQTDILNQDNPNFALLKPVSIAGETLFTIFTNKVGAKRKYFFAPIFKENTKAKSEYEKYIDMCNNTLLELRLAWNQFRPHSQYLSQISENQNKGPEEKIMSLFDLMLGYNPRKRRYNSGLEIMSQQGIPTYNTMRSSSQELQQCNITEVKIIELANVSQIIQVKDGILALKEPQTIMFYPVIEGKGLESSEGIELYYFRNVEKITHFKSVKLCNQQGIYIAGIKDKKTFGKVYKIENNNTLIHHLSLKVDPDSNVRGFCTEKYGACFIVNTIPEKGICTINCGKIIRNYKCPGKSQEETINLNENITIGVDFNNNIYKTTLQSEDNYKTTVLKEVNEASKIYMGASGHNLYISIIDPEEIQLCKLNEYKMDQEVPLACNKMATSPKNLTHITIGSVQKEICLFIGLNNSINMYMLSMNHVMVLNLEHELKHKVFDPFTIKRSTFVSFRTESKTTIIEYTICKPS